MYLHCQICLMHAFYPPWSRVHTARGNLPACASTPIYPPGPDTHLPFGFQSEVNWSAPRSTIHAQPRLLQRTMKPRAGTEVGFYPLGFTQARQGSCRVCQAATEPAWQSNKAQRNFSWPSKLLIKYVALVLLLTKLTTKEKCFSGTSAAQVTSIEIWSTISLLHCHPQQKLLILCTCVTMPLHVCFLTKALPTSCTLHYPPLASCHSLQHYQVLTPSRSLLKEQHWNRFTVQCPLNGALVVKSVTHFQTVCRRSRNLQTPVENWTPPDGHRWTPHLNMAIRLDVALLLLMSH